MKNESYFKEQLEKSKEREKLMRKIATSGGFYNFWFEQLPNFKTRSACFEYVNNLHLDFFGEEKYSSFRSFTESYKRHQKSKKK